MNCLIINPNWRDAKEVGRMCSIKTPAFPIELFYISDDLKRKGIKNKVLDLWAENKHLNDYNEELKNADYIVLTTAPPYCYWRDGTINADLPKRMLLELKAFTNAKIIIIGPHGTLYPNMFEDCFVIRGEPDLAVSDLIKNKNPCLEKIHNVENLSDLPVLSFSQNIDFSRYYINEIPKGYKGYSIFYETSRGCPFKCIFCCRRGFRDKLRFKQPEIVEQEVKRIKELGVNYIYLIDETFGIDKQWCFQIASIMKKYKLVWGFQTRPELLDYAWIDELYNYGCKFVYIGLETVNRKIAKTLGKGIEDLTEFKKIIDYMFGKGITLFLSMIIGSPGETKETIKEMEDFLMQLNERIICDIYTLIPYPGTEIWEMGKKEGKNLNSWDDIKKYAGTIGNNLRKTYVKHQERRLNIKIYKKRNQHLLKKPFVKLRFFLQNLFFKPDWICYGRW